MIRRDPARIEGLLFDIDAFAVHDGPGIRLAVYLKGCPLRCAWCHSPESQSPRPELLLLGDRCLACGACAEVCPTGAHGLRDGRHVCRRDRCQVCGRCLEACPAGALRVAGRRVPAGEIVARAQRCLPFFKHSGGGVTLTGGEVAVQADFTAAVLEGCRGLGIHTAIETSGACDWPTLQRLADRADLILYDLKIIDDAEHRRLTGVSNRTILDNAARLAGRDVRVRLPLIPGLTDTSGNVRDVLAFAREAKLTRIDLLPYNPASAAKYEWLDRPFELTARPQTDDQLGGLIEMARALGLEARIA